MDSEEVIGRGKCDRFDEDRLVLHLYGEEDAAGRLETEVHLAACPTCREEWLKIVAAGRALDRVGVPMPPGAKWDGLAGRVVAVAGKSRVRSTVPWVASLRVAAAILLLVGGAVLAGAHLPLAQADYALYASGDYDRLVRDYPESRWAEVAEKVHVMPHRLAGDVVPGGEFKSDAVVQYYDEMLAIKVRQVSLGPASPFDLLEVGEIYRVKLDRVAAREAYARIVHEFPDTRVAMLAGRRMAEMGY